MLTPNFDFKYLTHLLRLQIVGNKAKGRISKRVFSQQNKGRISQQQSTPNFAKNEHERALPGTFSYL